MTARATPFGQFEMHPSHLLTGPNPHSPGSADRASFDTGRHRFAPKLNREQVADIIARYKAGATHRELAAAFGVTNAAINYQLRAHGVTRADKPKPAALPTTDDGDDLAELAAALTPPGEWVKDALCAQTDPESFFPEKGGSTRRAKAVCAACPVAAECLDYALANNERFGIWGGVSERERRKLAHQPDDTGACGTYPKGYGRHKQRGEKPCDDCRLAANAYARQRRENGSSTPVDLSAKGLAS